MKTFSPSSKKCSTCSLILAALFFSLPSFAATSPPKSQMQSALAVSKTIHSDLTKHQSPSFDALLMQWQEKFGKSAFEPLRAIALNTKQEDKHRFVAIMGMARIAGRESAPTLHTLLKDKVWLMRMAALRALTGLGHRESEKEILSLLNDPALVVRSEAVSAIASLKLQGGVDALVQTIQDPKNYHRGKAQWVPNYALSALVQMGAPKTVASQLREILNKDSDPRLLQSAVDTFDSLYKDSSASKPLKDRVEYWKKTLAVR